MTGQPPEPLTAQAERFAAQLTNVLNLTVCDSALLRVAEAPDGRFFVGQIPPTATSPTLEALKGEPIPITGFESTLFIGANWRFGPSSTGHFLKTEWSQFGLFVPTRKAHRPVFRLEVDVSGSQADWRLAHIQVHGESESLGEVWGYRQAKDPKSLPRLHLPVGGFRYRPCLEDFIEFLVDEGLVPGKANWREALEATRAEYRRGQLWTLIVKNPNVAREALASLA